MDNPAISLDTAIDQALDAESGAVARISRLRQRILKRVNDRLLAGEDTSVGGNLLLSAAAEARDAARDGNLPRLVDARRDITEARNSSPTSWSTRRAPHRVPQMGGRPRLPPAPRP